MRTTTMPTTDSSASSAKLAHVTFGQVVDLLRTLRGRTHTESAYISQRYAERGRYFDETLAFLVSLGWAVLDATSVTLTETGQHAAGALETPEELRRVLASAVLTKATTYQSACCEYLRHFSKSGATLAYAPEGEVALAETDARNFLISLGVVERNANEGRFELTPLGLEVYLLAHEDDRHPSPDDVAQRALASTTIGRLAELAALKYEQERVGDKLAHHVRHVAASWPTAPYDIRSVTVAEGSLMQRYIEVKAVSADDWHFYWSAREIEVAELMGTAYMLYLIPYDGEPSVHGMRIITNPAIAVLKNPTAWSVTPDVVRCQPTESVP